MALKSIMNLKSGITILNNNHVSTSHIKAINQEVPDAEVKEMTIPIQE